MPTPIQFLGKEADCHIYVKREDLLPFSFGGNKARKAELFFHELQEFGADCVVTYGSSSSNHCRVVANKAAAINIPCHIISPQETSEYTFNRAMMELFGATFTVVPVSQVHDTIEKTLDVLKSEGHHPYFIPGGGHGNLGTQAYVNCYEEIASWQQQEQITFDYIFHASGTGTTQAGLICGKLLKQGSEQIIGISIARKCPRGREVVLDSVREYLQGNNEITVTDIQQATIFLDQYTAEGYGAASRDIQDTIIHVMKHFGLPLDTTYTGKAFTGMMDYLKQNNITNKKVLFIHTGGTPLFFDTVNKLN